VLRILCKDWRISVVFQTIVFIARLLNRALSNVTPADVYFGRHHEILSERRKTKEKTMKLRRLINHDHAA
ncbi:MAG: hypothetical protein N2B03_09370, partial [Boseongicola sp.]